MTDRIKTLRSVRSAAMKQLGFGPEVMKRTKVCLFCGDTANADEEKCSRCGADLPGKTLFDLYKSRHQYCSRCGTVVCNASVFCPECGKRLKCRQPDFRRRKVG